MDAFIGAILTLGAMIAGNNLKSRVARCIAYALAVVMIIITSLSWWKAPPEWRASSTDMENLVIAAHEPNVRFPVYLFPVTSNSKSKTYAERLLVALRRAGWSETFISPYETVNADTVGLHVAVSANPYSRNFVDARVLTEILNAAHVDHADPTTEFGLVLLEAATNQWGHVGIVVGIHP